MPRGGARPGSGPKKGAKLRKAIGPLIAEVEKARAPGGYVTKTTVDAYEKLCEVGIMFHNQAVEQYKLKAEGQKFDREFLNAALADSRDTFKEIIKYQRPSLKAHLIADPMGIFGFGRELPKPAGENVVPFPTDPIAAARAYQRMMAAAVS